MNSYTHVCTHTVVGFRCMRTRDTDSRASTKNRVYTKKKRVTNLVIVLLVGLSL